MKLVFILQSLAKSGGLERTITDKANYMAEQGHSVTIVTYEQGQHANAYELLHSVKCVDLDCRRFTLYQSPKYMQLYKLLQMKRTFVKRLYKLLGQLLPDMVIMTTCSDDFRREIVAATRRRGIKLVMESHTAYYYDKQTSNLLKRLYVRRDIHFIKKCDALIALTEGDSAFWRKYVSNVLLLRNPVSFYAENISATVREKGKIISVGRLDKPKRFDVLIDAFAIVAPKFPEWHLEIYGNGSNLVQLETQIERLHLSGRVTIHQPTPEIFKEYLSSQFLAFCSENEGFCLVLIEAMACGLPVLTVDCPYGPAEIVENGHTGWLCKMDTDEIAERMEWMISHEKERREMGRLGHENVRKYKKEKVMKEWEKAYSSLLV